LLYSRMKARRLAEAEAKAKAEKKVEVDLEALVWDPEVMEKSHSRDELNAIAEALGVEGFESAKKKSDVVALIMEKAPEDPEGTQDGDPGDEDPGDEDE